MAAELFISYSRNDPDSVSLRETIHRELTSRYGYNVFIDVEMDAGIDWRKEIKRNIAACDVFLLLLSKRAIDSPEVLDEFRYADFLRGEHERPRMLPVLVNCDLPDGELKTKIGPINYLLWRSPDDTPRLIAGIHKAISPHRKRRIIRASIAAGVVLLLTLLFLYFRYQIAVLRAAGPDEAGAVAAYRRLKLAPWLHGDALMRGYLERQARSLDQQAAASFEAGEREQLRDKVDEALMLSALAAIKRGGAPSQRALGVYAAQRYDRLITTIREQDEVPGVGLAVKTGPAHWHIAAGGHIWTCPMPLAERPCELTKKSLLNVVTASVFKSDDEIELVDSSSGRAMRLRLSERGSEERGQTSVTDVAADQGEIAMAYDTAPSVIIDRGDGAQEKSPDFGDVTTVRFGPCSDCISIRDRKGGVIVWHREKNKSERVGKRPALAIAATRSGRLAVIRDNGHLELYGPELQFSPGPDVDFRAASAIAMSSDGGKVAVVNDGAVRLLDEERELSSAELLPTVVAAAFADNSTLVTRTPRDVRIWRLDSLKREELTPIALWMKWRKQLGLVDVQHGPPGFGWDPAARDVRRY